MFKIVCMGYESDNVEETLSFFAFDKSFNSEEDALEYIKEVHIKETLDIFKDCFEDVTYEFDEDFDSYTCEYYVNDREYSKCTYMIVGV